MPQQDTKTKKLWSLGTGTEGNVLGSFQTHSMSETFDEGIEWKRSSVYTHHDGYKVSQLEILQLCSKHLM